MQVWPGTDDIVVVVHLRDTIDDNDACLPRDAVQSRRKAAPASDETIDQVENAKSRLGNNVIDSDRGDLGAGSIISRNRIQVVLFEQLETRHCDIEALETGNMTS
ncbi:hypothetical protein HRR81_002668 [Exophiala dermatitidis]|uniref:Uncharacterized protein n=1 Tax=Exophiala dermatitidis TaxID=5970 RepID=A0AAN6EUW6_EXODE|nr:hypothetical protein HRR74_004387 [Exophiala dermatitidis]KAJ4547571.1 hypothetical protein HRR76_000205 [Exophiala dermatitidis]KAJ4553511.1 hypothetical protein HRR77_001897 [Exophiala dermatitidis]KAJ4563380.1 hypothetical protein HRR79_006264 [Exophiala dermatitidis]KAJ4579695.1 hypothetical protein HRR82_004831 [Exophiala dermatitidis]